MTLTSKPDGRNCTQFESEIKNLKEELRNSEMRSRLIAEGANDGLWYWDLVSNEIEFSSRWKQMLGYKDSELGKDPEEWFGRVNRYHLTLLQENIRSHLKGGSPQFEYQYRILHKNGTYRWMLGRGVAERDGEGKPIALAGSQTDVTETLERLELLERNALHDTLTGLPNRVLFLDLLTRAITRAKRRDDYLFGILHLDLDRFKNINDSLGHAAGDQLLMLVTNRIRKCLRAGDTASRIGGDDFIILLDDLKEASDATRVASRIQEEFATPFQLGEREIFSSVSIGIALNGGAYEEAEDMLRDADTAMYRAKSQGRARHEVFDPVMHECALKLLQMEHDLRMAIERQEFEVHYQPIISLENNSISGFEALVRWRHPEHGLLYPMEFIPVAEDTGLIVPLCYWVLRESAKQLRNWQEKFPQQSLSLSMNFTGTQFDQTDVVDQIAQILAETGLPGKDLTMEITESIILNDQEPIKSKLRALKALQIQLHIDDFGTGYSSLSYLHRFPIDGLKIDRSFIGHIGDRNGHEEIVRTIVTLAHTLGMDVVAEGIEKEEQISMLRNISCEYGQGFFFSKAVEASLAEKLLTSAAMLA